MRYKFYAVLQIRIHFLYLLLFNFRLLDLISTGALPILTVIQKIFSDDIEMCILLARILSNISLHSEYLETIYESGKTHLIFLRYIIALLTLLFLSRLDWHIVTLVP